MVILCISLVYKKHCECTSWVLQSIPDALDLGTTGDDANMGIGSRSSMSSSFELMVMLLTPVGIINQNSVRCIIIVKREFLYQKKVDRIVFSKSSFTLSAVFTLIILCNLIIERTGATF